MDAANKDCALEFLKELEKTLNSKLLGPTDMKSWICEKVAAAKTDDKQKHLRLPEAAFLNGQALPVLSALLNTYGGGLSTADARRALLNESHSDAGHRPVFADSAGCVTLSKSLWALRPLMFTGAGRTPPTVVRWHEAARTSPCAIRFRIPSCSKENTSLAVLRNSRSDNWSPISIRPSSTGDCRL